MFEQASRLKLRFETNKGGIFVEDLWDMPLTHRSGFSLDDVAKNLSKAVKDSGEESFVVKKNIENATLELKFSIVKHIIKIRLEEAEAKENAEVKKTKKAQILRIIASKKDEALEGESIENLEKMVKNL